jgi:hypothetical protein
VGGRGCAAERRAQCKRLHRLDRGLGASCRRSLWHGLALPSTLSSNRRVESWASHGNETSRAWPRLPWRMSLSLRRLHRPSGLPSRSSWLPRLPGGRVLAIPLHRLPVRSTRNQTAEPSPPLATSTCRRVVTRRPAQVAGNAGARRSPQLPLRRRALVARNAVGRRLRLVAGNAAAGVSLRSPPMHAVVVVQSLRRRRRTIRGYVVVVGALAPSRAGRR